MKTSRGLKASARRSLLVGIASLCLVVAAAGAASADLNQLGYSTANSPSITGTQADLTATNGFNPDAGSCVLESVVLDAGTAAGTLTGHVEAGYARCAPNTTVDGTCSNGYRFVETFYGRYYCTQHAAFSIGATNHFSIIRSGNSATAYINGSTNNTADTGTGFNQPQVSGTAWMEHNGGGGCGGWGPAGGNYGGWQRSVNGVWGVGGAYYQNGAKCLTIGGLAGNGNFSIN